MSTTLQKIAADLLAPADIKINGSRPWDIQVHNNKLFERVFRNHSLGLGEAYMDKWWDCDQVDQLFFRLLRSKIGTKTINNKEFFYAILKEKLRHIYTRLVNLQSPAKSLIVGKSHYDLGNDLYELMLDKNLNYTCGYWKEAHNLDQAQIAKMDLACRKLYLEPNMRLLDIGCGFGSFAKYAAQNYGVRVVGVTISKEQQILAQKICAGLPIDIKFLDYRQINDKFDRIVSLGMFEHVGYKNYRCFMDIAARSLKPDGLFLLHTIGGRTSTTAIDPWIDRYIFPGSLLPAVAQIGKAIEPHFILEDWHNFGLDYAKTLKAWHHNFTTNLPKLSSRYDERFIRMWNYYLLSSAGGFLAKCNQLWQIVLTKPDRPGRYIAVR